MGQIGQQIMIGHWSVLGYIGNPLSHDEGNQIPRIIPQNVL